MENFVQVIHQAGKRRPSDEPPWKDLTKPSHHGKISQNPVDKRWQMSFCVDKYKMLNLGKAELCLCDDTQLRFGSYSSRERSLITTHDSLKHQLNVSSSRQK